MSGGTRREPSTHLSIRQASNPVETRTVAVMALTAQRGPGAWHLRQTESVWEMSAIYGQRALGGSYPNPSATRIPTT